MLVAISFVWNRAGKEPSSLTEGVCCVLQLSGCVVQVCVVTDLETKRSQMRGISTQMNGKRIGEGLKDKDGRRQLRALPPEFEP